MNVYYTNNYTIPDSNGKTEKEQKKKNGRTPTNLSKNLKVKVENVKTHIEKHIEKLTKSIT